jgi:acyl-ACP thioesterase
MNEPDLSAWYSDTYEIYHKDIDSRGELRLTALLVMLQETAWNHAHRLGVGYGAAGFENLIWVLSRMRIELIDAGPDWMRQVRLATSPTGVDRLFALRDFVAMHADGRPFARVTSAWILIDSATRKPVRPQSLLDNGNFPFCQTIVPEGAIKLRDPEELLSGLRRVAAWSDVDAHQHVNNVKYAEWCLDSYAQEHWEGFRLVEYDVNFNAETTWGQEITTGMAVEGHPRTSTAEQAAEGWTVSGHRVEERHTHVVRDAASGKSAAIIRFGWEPRRRGGPDA